MSSDDEEIFLRCKPAANVRNVVATLRALDKFPDFTDDQKEIMYLIILAFQNGDIPARDVQKMHQLTKSEKNHIQLFKKIYDIVGEKYLFGRPQAENLINHKIQVILSCSLKGS